MKTRYSKIIAKQISEAVIDLYGNIGDKVNGDYLASEINYLDKSADLITIRINSSGGNFIQGLSVIGALVGAQAKTVSIIEGVAGSMSSVIALSCSRVKMNDFARLMLHSPYFLDENGDKANDLNEDEKEAIKHFKGQMVDILSRRGKSKKEITVILEKDTWYTAEEALKAGFIDEIIDTGVAVSVAAEFTIDKLVAFANDKFLPTNTDMKKIAAKLGLPETADEQAIIAAIDNKETSLGDTRRKLIDAVIAAGKKSGVVNDTNVANMTKLGNTDLELLVDIVMKPSENVDNTRLSAVIAKLNEVIDKKEVNDEKDWDWYQKNNKEALAEMKVNDFDKFKKLYKGYWGQEYKA